MVSSITVYSETMQFCTLSLKSFIFHSFVDAFSDIFEILLCIFIMSIKCFLVHLFSTTIFHSLFDVSFLGFSANWQILNTMHELLRIS